MPTNYWTGDIPAGSYHVTIHHPDYRPYRHPRMIVVKPRPQSLRVDFLRLVARHRNVSLVAAGAQVE